MGTLATALKKATKRLEEDDSMVACEITVGLVNEEIEASVRTYRFSQALLESDPETGGRVVNKKAKRGRPEKYSFSSLAIGDSLFMPYSPSQCVSVCLYHEKKQGARYERERVEGGTNVRRVA